MESIDVNPEQGKRKRGEVRGDGRIFWRYKSNGREVWLPPEKVAEWKAKERARVDKSTDKARSSNLPPKEDRLQRGHIGENGMIFWAYFPNGKEQWLTEDQVAEKREKSKQAKRKHYANNAESELERAKKWRADNPEKVKEIHKENRVKNRDRRIQNTKDWRDRNAEHVKAYAKKYGTEKAHVIRANMNRRYKEDDLFALRMRLRSRTLIAFRQKGYSKDTKTADTLGCTWEELKAHIEGKFVDGMCWEKFEDIEIDHIIPVSSAKTKEELIALFNFKNLQPLWWWDNRLKGDKMPDELK